MSSLASDDRGKAAIASFLVDCFNALNNYGATPDQIKSSVKIHITIMEEYPVILIKKAYLSWIKTSSKQPTPADIISIIEEDNKKLLDYISHIRNGGNLTKKAQDYISEKLGNDWRKKYV